MTHIIEMLRVWSEGIMMALGYPGITLVMLLECVFPPIPSEVVMPLAGFLVSQGKFNFWAVILAGTLGSIIGALLLYGLGAWADEAVLRNWVRKHGKWIQVGEDDLDRASAWFGKYGEPVIFFGRLIPIVRSLISIPAGLDHMPMPKFLGFTLLGSFMWNIVLAYGGVLLGENWQKIIGWLDLYQNVVLVILVIAFVAFLSWLITRARKARLARPSETPNQD